jgi:hypothetical protein
MRQYAVFWPSMACLLMILPGGGGLAAADDPLLPKLRVRPVLCIADRESARCATVFQIDWQSREPGDYCIGSDQQAEPLRCWTQARTGEHADRVIVTRDFDYWIAQADSGRRLRAVRIELLRVHSEDRRRERRTRHVWDVL